MDSNIPTKPAYGVFISQFFKLVRYLRVCGSYQQFADRSSKLTSRLLKQGFDFTRLQNTFRKFLQRNPIVLFIKCYTIHTYKCLCLVLLCQCFV